MIRMLCCALLSFPSLFCCAVEWRYILDRKNNMAMDVFPDSPSLGMSTSSPRISFSHDVGVPVPVEEHYIRSPASSCDFDFCVFRQTLDLYEPSSADDLFLDGKILPIQIKRRLPPIPQPNPDKIDVEQLPLPVPPPDTERLVVPTPGKTVVGGGRSQRSSEEKSKSTKQWLFRRSSSFNCGGGQSGSSGLCPLPLLSRSFSTGSGKQQRPSAKQHNSSTNNILKHHNKERGNNAAASSNSRSPWKPKNMNNPTTTSSHYYGVKFQPVLNVLPPANLFGLGSIFSSRTSKKN